MAPACANCVYFLRYLLPFLTTCHENSQHLQFVCPTTRAIAVADGIHNIGFNGSTNVWRSHAAIASIGRVRHHHPTKWKACCVYTTLCACQNSRLLIPKWRRYFTEVLTQPRKFEEFSKSSLLSPLIKYLSDDCQNKAIVHALLALKMHFVALESEDDREIQVSRGLACEYVAWRFITHLSGRESIEFLLYELPQIRAATGLEDEERATSGASEQSPLLRNASSFFEPGPRHEEATPPRQSQPNMNGGTQDSRDEFSASFENLNALEIAAVSGAKKFLSQRVVWQQPRPLLLVARALTFGLHTRYKG
jgi:hypothetical protein